MKYLTHRLYQWWGAVIRAILKPGLGPIVKELLDVTEELKARKMEKDDYVVGDDRVVRAKK